MWSVLLDFRFRLKQMNFLTANQNVNNAQEEEKEIPKFGLNKDGSLDWILTEIKRLEKEGDLVQ